MKNWNGLCKGVGLLIFTSVMQVACVNHFSEEEDITNGGEIPLKFVANIYEVIDTRMVNNSFEEGDEVGLFALIENTTMCEERYADNLCFTRSSGEEFTSEASLYYPDDMTLDLISYYPYREEGVEMGKCTMPISVATDQDIQENYQASDFLVAFKEGIAATKDAVSLTYKHQLFRLKISLVPDTEEMLDDILSLSPTLSVNGFYTKALYDFQSKDFSTYSEEKEIILAGEWEIEDGRLVGKDCILIPQEVAEGYQYIILQANGKTYTCHLPSGLQLQSGKQRELEIHFELSEDILLGRLKGEISEWEGTDVDQVESETVCKYVDVAKLDFMKSNVYKVLSNGKQVAEICKEYLVNSDIACQAIVAYPMKEDDTVDLSQGIALQLLGQSGQIHGGKVAWNMENGSLNYTPGTLEACSRMWVLSDGELSLTLSMTDKVLTVLAREEVVRDVRGRTICNYPLVKIGTQYWMRNNLDPVLYTDGNAIVRLDAIVENATGYLQSGDDFRFYTANAALSPQLLPDNWSIPTWSDWDLLNTYLQKDASVLKTGEWKPLKDGGIVCPATNLAGFNAAPIGMWMEPNGNVFSGKYLGYWTLNDAGTEIADSVFYLKSDVDTIGKASSGIEKKAFAIRCIRKQSSH